MLVLTAYLARRALAYLWWVLGGWNLWGGEQ